MSVHALHQDGMTVDQLKDWAVQTLAEEPHAHTQTASACIGVLALIENTDRLLHHASQLAREAGQVGDELLELAGLVDPEGHVLGAVHPKGDRS